MTDTARADGGDAPPPPAGEGKCGDDVPDPPPCRDERHSAEPVKVGEDEEQPQTGVADTDLERHRASAGIWQPRETRDRVAEPQGKGIVEEDSDDDDADVGDEEGPVVEQRDEDETGQCEEAQRADDLARTRREPREQAREQEAGDEIGRASCRERVLASV